MTGGNTRQQRRLQEREDDKLLRNGIPADTEDPAPIMAQARRLLRILRRDPAAGAGDAAAAIHGGYDTALRHARPERTACKRGCTHCCVSHVGVTAPEVFLIARHLKGKRREMAASRVAAADAVTHGRTVAERFADPTPCPLLEEGACGVYAVRPTACRSLASFDADLCARSFLANSGETLSMPRQGMASRSNYQAALRAALIAAGLPAEAYELNAALNRVLTTPDAESRWLRGEPVFAGIAPETAPKPRFDELVRFLAGELGKE